MRKPLELVIERFIKYVLCDYKDFKMFLVLIVAVTYNICEIQKQAHFVPEKIYIIAQILKQQKRDRHEIMINLKASTLSRK